MSYVPARGLSLLLFIVAILLCLEGMEIAFVTFMILGLVFEMVDLVCGVKYLRQHTEKVAYCVGRWRTGWKARFGE